MINFLHTFEPNSLMFSFAFIKIHWYGFFVVLAIVSALFISLFLGKKYKINKDDLFDLFFYLIIFGVFGARIYDVFLEWRYYIDNPFDIIKIWQGGLAIHGAILAGVIVLCFFVKNKKIRGLENKSFWDDFFSLSFLIVPGLALGQAIGRFGNYFNQELFGRPTDFPWGIPINILNRPIEFISSKFFHPTFLYESLGSFAIFIFLFSVHFYLLKKSKATFTTKFFVTSSYLILYSILRFSLEFVRIDFAPEFLGLRFPQVMSVVIVFLLLFLGFKFYSLKMFNKN
ncbi:prolipoprotein diacylglyceryl transferase [Candidatus Falkowbacteria bacterium HGW-Falkowbacteria-1]|jgi:phosphatidylglycerol:prolipoprotein diacylglycerol transferase|uniref:Phosphatidylglycerol--prolipoprotein diacylglyceryl transferase n=1 Tax=Candidatus Falkowbacteria bacterium HGW-Falkowbacteria-1 TaxID=2013768 RepID=A0A2N2E8V1_9BACT|nr:MAG: prolipoprotein diacylglyceryl transferase [Candidatus Falkowbacteria bacterium HGW-Falkowbacteria-1]